ncbi:multidrug effflux MFS transporter [Reinekea marinisedimentorum]|uniref:Bcr/CflA family efflux transporter n=1 Tax=Reinekea marinisedimentorum TaxID=230495 RepID=A0A4V2UK42_9GAMM|nr:multidrug effflux MFS transporter [Reinekea marinisedimentorum]TCS42706.1 DHA1 family bicyclomycin/chloramphenicol resistance-like MFS transporter [Reinekea marinisedimentorum]
MKKSNFAILMAMVMASGPFAVDAYLPGIPTMAEFLGTGIDAVATTVSFYIFGMALGQLIGGPMADKFDKRNLIIIGLLLYAASSLVIATATSLAVIQIARVFQAIGGGFSIVCIAPLVRMRETGNEAAKLFSLIALIMVIAPAIAPTIGALILLVGNWQTIFYFTAAYSVFVALLVWRSLPKSPVTTQPAAVAVHKRYLEVMKNKTAMRYLAVQACGYSVMMVFVTNSSLIYQHHFGLSEQMFGLVFAANTLVNVAVNRLNSYLLNSIPASKLLQIAILIQAVFVAALIVLTATDAPVSVYVLGIMGAVGMLGAIPPNSNSLFISQYSENTGAASALLGSAQFVAASLAGGLSTLMYNGTLWPPVLTMTALVVLSNLFLPRAASSKLQTA